MHFCAKEMMLLLMIANPVTFVVVRHYWSKATGWVRG